MEDIDYEPQIRRLSREVAITLTMTVLTVVSIVPRLYTRIKLNKNFGWDDIAMIVSVVFAIAAETCTFLRLQYVIGYLKDEGKFAAGYGKMRQYDFAQELLWALAYATFELSIGFFFLQIASRTRQVVYKRMVIGSMVVVGLYNAGFIMFTFFICHPLATYWSLTDWSCVADGTRSGMDVAHSVVSATLELMFSTLIPVPLLWRLQMRRRQKFMAIGVLSLGTVATAASFIKIYYQISAFKATGYEFHDGDVNIYRCLGCTIAIIVANLACMQPLFRQIGRFFRGPAAHTSGNNSVPLNSLFGLRASPSNRNLVTAHTELPRLSPVLGHTWEHDFGHRHPTDRLYGASAMEAYVEIGLAHTSLSDSTSVGKERPRSGIEDGMSTEGSEGGILRTTDIQISYSTSPRDA